MQAKVWDAKVFFRPERPKVGGVLQQIKALPIEINSVEDHIHLLLVLPRVLSAAALVEECKVASSK